MSKRCLSSRRFLILSQTLGASLVIVALWISNFFMRLNFNLNKISVSIILIFVLFLVISIIFHELLHYLAFTIFGGAPRTMVDFKFNNKALVFSVACRCSVTSLRYRVAAILPFAFLGITLLVLSIFIDCKTMFWISIYHIFGSSNDILVFLILFGFRSGQLVERTAGCVGFQSV